MSGLAITVFVVSLLALLPILSGFLALAAGVLVFAAIVLWNVRWTERRGRGLVIAAIVVGLLGGIYGYLTLHTFTSQMEDRGAHLLAALRGGDESQTAVWMDEEARKAGAVERLRKRYAQVSSEVGPYRGPMEVGGFWFGAMPALTEPDHGPELAAEEPEAKKSPPDGTIWMLATFEKGVLHVAFVPRGAGTMKGQIETLQTLATSEKPVGIWTDVRFYRVR